MRLRSLVKGKRFLWLRVWSIEFKEEDINLVVANNSLYVQTSWIVLASWVASDADTLLIWLRIFHAVIHGASFLARSFGSSTIWHIGIPKTSYQRVNSHLTNLLTKGTFETVLSHALLELASSVAINHIQESPTAPALGDGHWDV
jgi:hypothetical protein